MGYRFSESWARLPFGIFRDPLLRRSGRWIAYSALIGAVAGLGAIGFDLAFRAAQWGLLQKVGRFLPPSAGNEGGPGFPPQVPWLLPVSLVLGGLVAGALVFGLAPEAEGHGTDAVIDAFHRRLGRIRGRVPIVKALASAITIGSGGSAGREGPIAQIGAGFGSLLASFLELTNRERRIMMMAGVAGGIGGIFKAPLGATLFSAEVLYSTTDFEHEVLLPGLISSITSYSIYSSYAGWGFLFEVPPISFHRPRQLLLYAVLGLLCALIGSVYPKVFYGARDRVFRPLPVPRWLKPAIGALALGAIAVYFPQALGMGYGYVQEAIRGQHTVEFLLIFALVKILATSLTISSGGSGGVFGPSLVIGGALGGAFGRAATAYLPGLAAEPAAFVMVGMGGFFAGVAKVPFASVIMVMEMTGSYGLLVPSLLVAAVAYLCLPPSLRLYENQVPRRVDSPVHFGSFATEVLEGVALKDVWSPPPASDLATLRRSSPLDEVMDLASRSRQTVFPVLDDDGRLAGEISMEDLRRHLLVERPSAALVAADFMREVPEPLVPDDDLARAAQALAAREAQEISVVDDRRERRLLGVFGRHDLIVAYGKRIDLLQRAAEESRREDP